MTFLFMGRCANRHIVYMAIELRPEPYVRLCTARCMRHEAGPTGYGLYRSLVAEGLKCKVVAPSRTPRKPGDRIKNDTRDATMLARLLRAGELTAVWVPDEVHEAMRDLARARQTSSYDVRKARQRIQSFLLRHDRRYGAKCWTYRHRVCLSDQSFEHTAQQIAFKSYLNAHEQAESRRNDLDTQIAELIPQWSLAPIVERSSGHFAGLRVQFDIDKLGGAVDGNEEIQLPFCCLNLGNVDVKVPQRVGFELLFYRLVAIDIGQPTDIVTLQTAMQ